MKRTSDASIVRCPAKVNLALSVGAPRADGYHPIASWMVAIDLCDELRLEPQPDGSTSTYTIAWAADALRPSAIDWSLDKDLAVRAHRLVEQHVGRPLPIAMQMTKRIPVGAGLAGGSSDGAGMLMGLNEVFSLGLSTQTLIELAMQLGSDLAFFFSGGAAIVTGRGEHVEPVALRQAIHLVVMMPEFGCPTGGVYKAFDELQPEAAVDESAVRQLATAEPLADDAPFSDLAAPAERVQPQLASLRQRCGELTGRPVHITGSGAGMFIVARDREDAEQLAAQVGALPELATLATHTVTTTDRV
jgi:4-diphosphocytidyl-2-C-methyl-D-erythritol kinase